MLRLIETANNGVEFTLLAADSPFVMGFAAVVVNRISLVEYLYIIAHLNLELTADNDIHFLTLVRMRVRNAELLVNVGDSNEERLGELISELRRETLIAKALAACDRETLALSCDIKTVDVRTFTLHKVGNLNAAHISKLVDETEAEILSAALISEVFVGGDIGFLSHFSRSEAYRLAYSLNSLSDLSHLKLGIN